MRQHADICLILEGTYPFVTGGVSHWVHELLNEQNHLSFHLLAIVPQEMELELKYQLPNNVVGLQTLRLGELPEGDTSRSGNAHKLHETLYEPLSRLTSDTPMELEQLRQMVNALRSSHLRLGQHGLLDRQEAWDQLIEIYQYKYDQQSFLDFFWSYRAIISGFYSILLADLPSADVYHALSTGYAGLMLARAKLETDKPCMVTEHGIYTNERRIEVVSADWLEATSSKSLTIDKPRSDLRDLWIDSINNFSHLCYQACDHIITLFKGNQLHQLADGADPAKMQIIPNGVNIERFSAITRMPGASPCIGLIGRVVPIKDIKSYIRAVSLLKGQLPEINAYIMGPYDEDPDYYNECQTLISLLNLEANITFTGRVKVDDYLSKIDVMVLTSLSEAQPLVMQEAGAAGIPLVATDVGACRELIEGTAEEKEAFGAGGFVTPLANPAAVAEAIVRLLGDQTLYAACSDAIRQRMARYYDLNDHQTRYRDLYARHLVR